MTSRRRIWITGIGVVTPIGTGVDAFRAGLRRADQPAEVAGSPRRLPRLRPLDGGPDVLEAGLATS